MQSSFCPFMMPSSLPNSVSPPGAAVRVYPNRPPPIPSPPQMSSPSSSTASTTLSCASTPSCHAVVPTRIDIQVMPSCSSLSNPVGTSFPLPPPPPPIPPRSIRQIPSTDDPEKAMPEKPGVHFLMRMALKMFGVVSRKLDRTQSEMDNANMESANVPKGPSMTTYQQSSTRRLAFGNGDESEEAKKPIDDFYNNSTLTNVSKLFCAIVLLIAFFLVMSKSFKVDFPYLT